MNCVFTFGFKVQIIRFRKPFSVRASSTRAGQIRRDQPGGCDLVPLAECMTLVVRGVATVGFVHSWVCLFLHITVHGADYPKHVNLQILAFLRYHGLSKKKRQ